jgi:hypothetical protein
MQQRAERTVAGLWMQSCSMLMIQPDLLAHDGAGVGAHRAKEPATCQPAGMAMGCCMLLTALLLCVRVGLPR